VKVKSSPVIGKGASGTKGALTFTQSRRATELEATTLLIFALVNYLETSKTGIATIVGEVKRA
jgi:hypothetical protein